MWATHMYVRTFATAIFILVDKKITHLHNPVINNCRKTCVKSSRRGPFFIAECAWMYSSLILNYLYLHAEFAHNPVVLCATWGVVHCDPEWTRHTSLLLPRARLMWCVLPSRMDETHICYVYFYFTFAVRLMMHLASSHLVLAINGYTFSTRGTLGEL